jgi:hypothetical protein
MQANYREWHMRQCLVPSPLADLATLARNTITTAISADGADKEES